MHPALTRSHFAHDHLLLTPESRVAAPLAGWQASRGVVLIGPQTGARFSQVLALMGQGGRSAPPAEGVQRCAWLLSGRARVSAEGQSSELEAGGYAYFPAGTAHSIEALEPSELLLFEKLYSLPPGRVATPRLVLGHDREVSREPFLGDEAALLQTLLPDEPGWDMAINVFTFAPGAHLPMVELHVMEHGVLFLAGAGVYRLGDSWYPVSAGDAIWMAPYLPQWFCAIGKSETRYIYYKDMNRDPLIEELP